MRLLWVFLLGCQPDLERMKDQPNLRPYQASELFSDGRAMQAPPAHTVPRGSRTSPPPIDRALLQRGRARFDIFCAACHGRRGDGRSEVARNMELRPPPSLIEQPIRGFSDARLAGVIGDGYGLMPSYALELPYDERWAVVAYLRALQLSASIEIDRLPGGLP